MVGKRRSSFGNWEEERILNSRLGIYFKWTNSMGTRLLGRQHWRSDLLISVRTEFRGQQGALSLPHGKESVPHMPLEP